MIDREELLHNFIETIQTKILINGLSMQSMMIDEEINSAFDDIYYAGYNDGQTMMQIL